MSRSVFIISPSGGGKTSSIKNLNPSETFIINTLNKELPWKGSSKQYKLWDKTTKSGNMIVNSDTNVILQWLDFISEKLTTIKNIVIDDNTFVTALELQRRKDAGWQKFDIIVDNFLRLAEKSKQLREDIVVFFLHHTMETGDGIVEDKMIKALSFGKFTDEKLGGMEAQFTMVIRAAKQKVGNDIEYVFYTKDANSTTKTPFGMFDQDQIPNDLTIVRKAIDNYYNEE